MIPATVQGPRPRPAARLHRCAAYHRAGVMFSGLTGGTKGPLLPKPRRRISLDVCVPPPHPIPSLPVSPPPPALTQTHTVTVAGRSAASGAGSQKEHLIHLQTAFPLRTKKLKGDRRLF